MAKQTMDIKRLSMRIKLLVIMFQEEVVENSKTKKIKTNEITSNLILI